MFCKELFSDEEKMIYEAMRDFATNELLPLSQNELNKKAILDELNRYLCLHIKKQHEAGAEVIQIFDSWAGLIPENEIYDYCYRPNLRLVEFCKKIGIPVICFPKGLGEKYKEFLEIVKPDGLNIDYDINPIWAKKLYKHIVSITHPDKTSAIPSKYLIEKFTKQYMTTISSYKNKEYHNLIDIKYYLYQDLCH